MNLEDYRTVFIASSLILSLVAATPVLSFYLPFSGRHERFSELWLLGPEHSAEAYPFNVTAEKSYFLHVGIGNHLGSSAYYVVSVKLRNQSGPLPNATAGTASLLPALYEYRVFLQDGKTWEAPVAFAFSGVSFVENQSLVETVVINDVAFGIAALALWDEANNGYYYQLFMELWICEVESEEMEYHNRFVGIWLNMTSV